MQQNKEREIKMERGRNLTAAERSLYIIGVLAGKSLEEINAVLEKDNRRIGKENRFHPQTSYDDLRHKYAPTVREDSADTDSYQKLWEHVTSPKPYSKL